MPDRTSNDVFELFVKASPVEWLKFIGAFVLLGAMIWLIVRIREWLWDDEGPADADEGLLLQFNDLRREGGLTEQEYRSIRSQLVARIDGSPRAETSGLKSPAQESNQGTNSPDVNTVGKDADISGQDSTHDRHH